VGRSNIGTFFVIYTIFKLTTEEDNPKSNAIGNQGPVGRAVALVGVGIVGLYFGAQWTVESMIEFSKAL